METRMPTLKIVLLFCSLIASSSGAVYRGHYNDTNYPSKCVITEFDMILSPGDIVQHPKHCGRLLCFEKGLVIGHTCGAIGPPPGCILGEPLKPEDPYPDCCQREFICNNIEPNK